MALANLSDGEAVLSAINEFDQLGRKAFLLKYGFGEARSYFLIHNGRHYDSKAIVGAAHKFEFGTQLTASDFSGGAQTVQKKLEELGFSVEETIALPLTRLAEPLNPGDTLSNAELMKFFDVGMMGGMRRSLERGHLVIVSDHTKSLYEDRWEGPILHYTGMGKVGHQEYTSQNKTLADAKANGTAVYLFEVFQPGKYVYHGEVELAGEPYREIQPDDEGEPRHVLMFPVRPLTSGYEPTVTASEAQLIRRTRERKLQRLSLEQLKRRAMAARPIPVRRTVRSDQIVRNEDVAAYVKRAAEGRCDLCTADAPFAGRDGVGFLECHHIVHLASDGPDTILNTVALCPNCHRKMHVLNLAKDVAALKRRVAIRELG